MTLPTAPVRQYSFTAWSVANPATPVGGDHLDAEFDRTNSSVASTIAFVGTVFAPDGTLLPNSVPDSALQTDYQSQIDALEVTAVSGEAAFQWAEYLAGPVVNPEDAAAYIAASSTPDGYFYDPVEGGPGGLFSAKWWALQAAAFAADFIEVPVLITDPTNNQVLNWSTELSKWINGSSVVSSPGANTYVASGATTGTTNSGSAGIESGDPSAGTGQSGIAYLGTSDSTTVSGDLWIYTGAAPAPGTFHVDAGSGEVGGEIAIIAGSGSAGVGGSVLTQGGDGTVEGGWVYGYAGSSVAGNGGVIGFYSGTSETGRGGRLELWAGSSTEGDGGNLELISGDAGGTGLPGDMSLFTGSSQVNGGTFILNTGTGVSDDGGWIQLFTGNSVDGDGGRVQVTCGVSENGIGGNVGFWTGRSTTSDGGDFLISLGAGGGRNGQFVVDPLPATDPVVFRAIWSDHGALVQSGTTIAQAIAAMDFSTLPTSNPGGGRLWLNGGVLQVGA